MTDTSGTWIQLPPGSATYVDAQAQLPAGTPAVLGGQSNGLPMRPLLDATPVLFWNEPPRGCGALGPPRCQRGWWLTRRVFEVAEVEIRRPGLTLRTAASCVDRLTCEGLRIAEDRSITGPTSFVVGRQE
ncbi:MAG: hypothetical protein R3F60_16775 [bacterium]